MTTQSHKGNAGTALVMEAEQVDHLKKAGVPTTDDLPKYTWYQTLETEVVVSIMENLSHPEKVLEDTADFSRELFMGFLAKDALIGILFSGSRSKCLVQKIEIALKELVFGAYPQYRENRDINIMLTYILYGCYYAFYENRKYGDVPVLSSITELTGETAAAALKMVNK